MTFLPATFVAAILSIGAFDWTQDPPTVYPSFWVFWVWAVPTTLLTLVVYFGWKQYNKAKVKREEVEAKEKEDREGADMVRPPDESMGNGSSLHRRRKHRSKGSKPEAPVAAMA